MSDSFWTTAIAFVIVLGVAICVYVFMAWCGWREDKMIQNEMNEITKDLGL